MIYFDNNATTALDHRVLDSMRPYLGDCYANPSSLYQAGRIARSALETARVQVAALFSVQAKQVIFTSGGTEANNLALQGWRSNKGIAVSSIEHASILDTARSLQLQGCLLETIPVDSGGKAEIPDIEALLERQIGLVSIMLANNETGVLQDIAKIAASCRHSGIVLHTDAVQATGKIPVSFPELGVNLMSVSSHKMYGPKGCGALIIDSNINLSPIFTGGTQERGLRAGTENVAAIVGFGKAAELARSELDARAQALLILRQALETGLREIPGIQLFSEDRCRLPNTIQFGLQNVDGEMLLMRLDRKGIAVSSGSACKSGGGEVSHVLTAMGVEPAIARSAIRISLGQNNTIQEVEKFLQVLHSILTAP